MTTTLLDTVSPAPDARSEQRFEVLPPLSLYLHLPWCVRKCPYCDFNSHALSDELPESAYVKALLCDLDDECAGTRGRSLESIFIGGGTPSLFSAEALQWLLDGVRARIPLSEHCEITLEANPGVSDAARFRGYRDAGVSRLSIGVQSFADRSLERIGRIHDGAAARNAIAAARLAGFDNVNVDLMFGLPDQSVDAALGDIDTAVASGASHISHYQLTLEPNTLFYRRPPRLPLHDASADMQLRCRERLAETGYGHYEVSAYARGGRRCVHNVNYWRFGDYIGVGAGAHGKITDARQQVIVRTIKQKHPRRYLAAGCEYDLVQSRQVVAPADAAFEFMLNALRLVDGFPADLFATMTGLSLAVCEPALAEARARGLLEGGTDWIRPTDLGQRFLDDLVSLFLPRDV